MEEEEEEEEEGEEEEEEEKETFAFLQNFRSFVHSLNKMGRCLVGGSKRIELVKLALRFSGPGSAALNISIWRNTHQEPQTRRAVFPLPNFSNV